jgi:hypothetical protein
LYSSSDANAAPQKRQGLPKAMRLKSGHRECLLEYLPDRTGAAPVLNLGDPRLLGREVEVFGIQIGDAGLVTGLSGEPDEEPRQGGQSGVQRRLAQRLTAAVAVGRQDRA